MMRFTVRVPASSANLGSGSDCLGLALSLYLYVTFEEAEEPSISFGRGFDGPVAEEDNLVLSAMRYYASRTGRELPVISISMETDFPISRGLGSSSASIVAGLLGACRLLGDEKDDEFILRLATELEGHPDNVSPALLGGFTTAFYDGTTLCYRHYDAPDITATVIIPSYRLSTMKLRAMLPQAVPLKTAIGQLQRAVMLSNAIVSERWEDLAVLTQDLLFEPRRKTLMPGFDDAVKAALGQGALCGMISGAGPTILTLCREENGDAIGTAAVEVLKKAGVSAVYHIVRPDEQGAVYLEQ